VVLTAQFAENADFITAEWETSVVDLSAHQLLNESPIHVPVCGRAVAIEAACR